LDPRFAGLNPAKDSGFLRAIKTLSTTSFGGEVKPSVPCCEILQHVKELYRFEGDISYAKFMTISCQVSLALLLDICW
jgi:hypothetical protein